MIDDSIEQRSLAWHRSRCGHFTGSRISELIPMGRAKGELFSQTGKSYIYQVAAERLFNPSFLNDDEVFQDYIDQTSYTTKAMQWGCEMEEQAKDCFRQLHEDVEMADVASCKHDRIPFFSASPDGVVYERDGGEMKILEVKCPSLNTYMKYRTQIKDGDTLKAVEPKYYWQMMAEMSCTDTTSGYFIAYCPWLTKPIHCVEIIRNKEDVTHMEARVILANSIVKTIINK